VLFCWVMNCILGRVEIIRQTYSRGANFTMCQIIKMRLRGVVIPHLAYHGVSFKYNKEVIAKMRLGQDTDQFHALLKDYASTFYERGDNLQLIGEGGFSKVFRRRDEPTLVLKVTKILKRDELQASEEGYLPVEVNVKEEGYLDVNGKTFQLTQQEHGLLQRSWREALVMADIGNPLNLPTIQGDLEYLGRANGLYTAINMEYVAGVPLERCSAEDFDVEEILQIINGVAQAAQQTHEGDSVHRDIKPGNVIIDKNYSGLMAYLVDLGISTKRAGADFHHNMQEIEDLVNANASLIFTGTPCNVAPEQLRVEHDVTFAIDAYQIGVLMYRLCTGRRLIEDNPHNIFMTLQKDYETCNLRDEKVSDMREARPDFPADMLDQAWRLLDGDPQMRGDLSSLQKVIANNL
jgi:serine/threonine protein kinase